MRSGRLRVGFDGDSVPWAFLNGNGEAVGFDAEMAHQLALALGVRLEHVVVPRERFAEALANGTVDIVMSGWRATARRTEAVAFSRPYAEEAIAFLVEDHRRGEFSDFALLTRQPLRIAVLGLPEWMEALKRALPNAEVVPVASPLDFVEGRVHADGLLTSWERACAWSLLYPELAPALPQPRPGNFSLSYALPRGEPELLNMVDTFIDVARAAGRLDSARAHWIEGEATRQKQPRWSIARDLLGWWRD